MEKKDGGSAFPSHGSMGEVAQEGMSLRDYFAGKFLQALIIKDGAGGAKEATEDSARALIYADALLEARNK